MRIALNLAAIVTLGLLAACTSEETCTEEIAKQKAADLQAKLEEVVAADPMKLAELAPKVQELAALGADDADLQAACKAMDDMMAELSK